MAFDPARLKHFDHDKFLRRLRGAIRELGAHWRGFCSANTIPPDGALTAIRECKADLMKHVDMLERIAKALGRDLEWLLTGKNDSDRFARTAKSHSHQLVDEFIEKDDVPAEDHQRLHAYLDEMIDSLQAHTAQAAFRRGLPVTWRDVAWMYQDMLMARG